MLEPYRELLAQLRRDPSTWHRIRYAPTAHPKRKLVDAGALPRYGVLLCLQYDHSEVDHALIRFCLEAEVEYKKASPHELDAPGLRLALILLSGYRRPEDVPLLWQTRPWDFEYFCNYDFRFMLWVDRSAAIELISTLERDKRNFIAWWLGKPVELLEQADLEGWWNEQLAKFPPREEEEDPLVLAERACYLGVPEQGREYLDRWERSRSLDYETFCTLARMWEALGEPARSLAAAEKMCKLRISEPMDLASELINLAKQHVPLGQHEQAEVLLAEVGNVLYKNPGLFDYSIGRATTQAMLDLVLDVGCPLEVRTRAWGQATGLIDRRTWWGSLALFEKAEKAGELLQDAEGAAHFTRLADQEYERIRKEASQIIKPAQRPKGYSLR